MNFCPNALPVLHFSYLHSAQFYVLGDGGKQKNGGQDKNRSGHDDIVGVFHKEMKHLVGIGAHQVKYPANGYAETAMDFICGCGESECDQIRLSRPLQYPMIR
jgi:hypothetical protein